MCQSGPGTTVYCRFESLGLSLDSFMSSFENCVVLSLANCIDYNVYCSKLTLEPSVFCFGDVSYSLFVSVF